MLMFAFTGVVLMEDGKELAIDAEEGIATAETVNFFNDLFDSVNSSEVNDNILGSPVKEDSAHHTFWTNTKHVLRKMRYVDKITRESKIVPSLRNWLITIDGFQKLWKIVNLKYGFNHLKTRYCNQDPIENFFGQIRSHAVRNINPTLSQFQDSFVTLLLSNMKSISIASGNCEVVKDSFMLFSLKKYLEHDVTNIEAYDIDDSNDIDEPHELFSSTVIREESSI
ncbi:uncharacterized protein LOC113563113 [Ooceraea biroi]|uniref:uncharacterized protein LOC113563113 n=1 Tax=Ooceraea biroi TaxID=2015173 RepID=UPI000F084202|nr:uncharacterized protein LOC113563113 [Ooceraea biroi]